MIYKTCAEAGHRWSVGTGRAGRGHWWVEIRWCLRRGCRRHRYEDDRGQVFTYDLTSMGLVPGSIKVLAR